MAEDEDLFAATLLGEERALPTSRLSRAFKTGRSAFGLATTMLGRRDGDVDSEAMRRLTRSLGELKGLGMKMGQILSFIDPSLPPETRRLLSVLQRQAPASEAAAVRATLERAFGARAEVLIAAMEPRPTAVASIAQVHRATLPEVGAVAVKVRHPGIDQALEADFSTARGGLGVANTILFGAASDAKGVLEEARAVLLAECDFRREAEHQQAFGQWLRDDPVLVVPELVRQWCTEEVLVTRWAPGLSLEAFLATQPTQDARDVAGEALFRASVGGFHQIGRLHADPHPGNFAFADGRVILYDFGCVRRFSRAHTEAFTNMQRALLSADPAALMTAGRSFGFRVTSSAQAALLDRFARSFFAPMLVDGPSVIAPDGAFEARQMMRDKRAMMKLGIPPQLLFLLRLRFGLYAVLAQLAARCDWGALERGYETATREADAAPAPA